MKNVEYDIKILKQLEKQANAPNDFKVYETRDGKFSSRIGPYFLKGKKPNVTFGIRIMQHHTNLNGVAHGGLLMAFLDTVGGHIAASISGEPSVTAMFNSSFLRPVPLGTWAEATAKVLKNGNKAVFVRATMTVEESVVCSVEGLWQKINKKVVI